MITGRIGMLGCDSPASFAHRREERTESRNEFQKQSSFFSQMAALDTFMAKQPDTAKEVDKSKEETDSLKTDSSTTNPINGKLLVCVQQFVALLVRHYNKSIYIERIFVDEILFANLMTSCQRFLLNLCSDLHVIYTRST